MNTVDDLMKASEDLEEVRLVHEDHALDQWFIPKFRDVNGAWACLSECGLILTIDGDYPHYKIFVDSPGPVETEFRYLWFDAESGWNHLGSALFSEEYVANNFHHKNMIKAEWSKTEMAIV